VNTASPVRVSVTDSVVSNSAGGIAAHNAGAGNVFVAVQRTTFSQNSGFGLKTDGSGGAGGIVAAVSDSLLTGNGTGLQAQGGPAAAVAIQVTRSSVVNSVTTGMLSAGAAGPAFIFVSNTLMTGNATALSATGGGNLLTYKNNSIDANPVAGAFSGTVNPE
jgi:hypothetical protein